MIIGKDDDLKATTGTVNSVVVAETRAGLTGVPPLGRIAFVASQDPTATAPGMKVTLPKFQGYIRRIQVEPISNFDSAQTDDPTSAFTLKLKDEDGSSFSWGIGTAGISDALNGKGLAEPIFGETTLEIDDMGARKRVRVAIYISDEAPPGASADLAIVASRIYDKTGSASSNQVFGGGSESTHYIRASSIAAGVLGGAAYDSIYIPPRGFNPDVAHEVQAMIQLLSTGTAGDQVVTNLRWDLARDNLTTISEGSDLANVHVLKNVLANSTQLITFGTIPAGTLRIGDCLSFLLERDGVHASDTYGFHVKLSQSIQMVEAA